MRNLKFSKKSFLLIALFFLLVGKASATSPDVASRVFRSINFCKLIFEELTNPNSKLKNISVTVYDADRIKVNEKSNHFIELFGKEFSKEDLNKIYIGAITDSSFKFFSTIDNLNKIQVENLTSECRKLIY
jgi:hypothetical protein